MWGRYCRVYWACFSLVLHSSPYLRMSGLWLILWVRFLFGNCSFVWVNICLLAHVSLFSSAKSYRIYFLFGGGCNCVRGDKYRHNFGALEQCIININLIIFFYLRVFHTTVGWRFTTGDWMSASFIKSPGCFTVFWLISTML